tara:strand:+ start:4144 stop:4380 length:237 start_codon:yes stop_codon:yes gene_type:complete
MGAGVPSIHPGQNFIALVNGEHRPFFQHIQFAVRHNNRHFDDFVVKWVQTCHFHINPHQAIVVAGNLGFNRGGTWRGL